MKIFFYYFCIKYFLLNWLSQFFRSVFAFYIDGFKSMTIGRTLWLIILLKLFLMFAVLKLFFFPDFLKTNYKTEEEKQQHVIEQLIHPINHTHD